VQLPVIGSIWRGRERALGCEMDIYTQAEVVLREAGYDTWQSGTGTQIVTCFESQSVVGFVHVFETCDDLLKRWRDSQQVVLNRYAAALRPAGAKAWNVYSVFLTATAGAPLQVFEVEKIEEDFTLTRKIARCNVAIAADVSNALLPLLPVRSFAGATVTDYETQLQKRLSDVDQKLATAFLGTKSASEVATLLVESS
jgi:hypothetical protein